MILSILAGIAISLGCILYLTIGGITGAILFCVGLSTILIFKWNLFTGKAGLLITQEISIVELSAIWLGNLIGTALTAMAISLTPVGEKLINSQILQNIVQTRNSNLFFENMILGIFCGLLMYIAVFGYYYTQNLAFIIWPVAVFILSGFNHCVADMFYLILGSKSLKEFESLIPTTLGNVVGAQIIPLLLQYHRQKS